MRNNFGEYCIVAAISDSTLSRYSRYELFNLDNSLLLATR